MIFYAQKVNNKLEWEAPTKVKEFMASIPDCRLAIVIKKYRKPRTNPQNNYYWKVLEIAGVDLGYEPEELHSSFKAMFLTDRSREIPLVRSTTKLTTLEFGQYLDKVLMELAKLNIQVMTPEEFYNIYEVK